MPALERFSRRNVGRLASLEGQCGGCELPLRGVAYDPRERCVDVVFGDAGTDAPHLMRSITHITRIDLLTGLDGRDHVLRLAQRDGQTLLTLL